MKIFITIISILIFIPAFSKQKEEKKGIIISEEESTGSRGITSRDLVTIKDIKTVSVSPDGRYIAYQISQADIESNGYNIAWYVMRLDSRKGEASGLPLLIADGGEPIFALWGVEGGGINGEFYGSPAIWSRDSRQFAYALKRHGEIQLWISRVDQPGQRQLTHNGSDVRYAVWSRDGSKVYFSVDRRRADLDKLHRQQRDMGYLVLANLFASSIDMPSPPPCQDDNSNDAAQARGDLDERTCKVAIWTLNPQTGRESVATPQEAQDYYLSSAAERESREAFTLDGDARRLLTQSEHGQRQAWVENVDAHIYRGYMAPRRVAATVEGNSTSCLSDRCTSSFFQGLWWSKDGSRVVVMAKAAPKLSVTSIYTWRPGAKEVHAVLQTDDQFRDCHLLSSYLICVREAWTSPGSIASIELASGRIATLMDPNPDFKNIEFTRVDKYAWRDAYGNMALGHLVYPKEYRIGIRYPLIITTYRSGGFLRGATGDEQPIHVFAQNGFFVLSFEVSEDEESQAKISDLTQLNIRHFAYPLFKSGPSTALDIMLDRLDQRDLIDPARIGITSFSYGANLVDTALVRSHRYAAASAAWSPISPAMSSFRPSAAKKVGEILYGGDVYGAGLEKWRENSIAFNAQKIDVPLLIQAADREYFLSLQNFMALKNAGKPVEMYRFLNEYHVKWQPIHRYTVYNRNVDWFNFWLRGVENREPDDAGQNRRWHELRKLQCKNSRLFQNYCGSE